MLAQSPFGKGGRGGREDTKIEDFSFDPAILTHSDAATVQTVSNVNSLRSVASSMSWVLLHTPSTLNGAVFAASPPPRRSDADDRRGSVNSPPQLLGGFYS